MNIAPHTRKTLIRSAAGLGFALVLVWLMSALESVTTMLLAGFIMAYVLNPAASRLARIGISSSTAAFVVIASCLVGLLGLMAVVLPAVGSEIAGFVRLAPKYLAALQQIGLKAAEHFGIAVPSDWNELLTMAAERGKEILPKLSASAAMVASALFESGLHILSAAFYMVMIPLIAFYLMGSFEEIKSTIADLIPPYARGPVIAKAVEIDGILAAFIRGQLTVAAILGVLYSLGFLVIGLDLALVLGILSGLLWVIPYVGTAFALFFGSLMALAKYQDPYKVLHVIGIVAVIQTIESYVLTPRIVGQAVGLHPVVYILALIVGANLFGFVGMLAAIPVAAVLKVLLISAVEAYKKSSIYADRPADRSA